MANPPLTHEQIAAARAVIDSAAIDAMTEADVAAQITADPDVPRDLSDAPADALRVIHPPGGISVRGIRAKLDLTQEEFAARFGFTVGRLRDWEQGRTQPDAATQTLLFVIERDPELVASVVARRDAA